MQRLTIFLNELSLVTEQELSPREMLPHVLATLNVARDTKKLRPDLVVVGGLAGVPFGAGAHTFASVLRGADYREEWQFLRSLEERNTSDLSVYRSPDEIEEAMSQGTPGIGLLLAIQNESAVLSFAFTAPWANHHITATHSKLDENDAVVNATVEVPNLSKPEHVATHETLLRQYGLELTSSSIIYDGEDFVLRMYFNDHLPPHFHVMSTGDSSQTIARFAIRTLDQLEQTGQLSPAIRRRVVDWASSRTAELMRCWADCRDHRFPPRFD